MTRLFLACSALLCGIALATHTTTAAPQTDAALQATNYMRGVQNTDGGFPDFGATSSTSGTLDAVFGFSSAGIDARTVENDGASPDEYLATQAAAAVVSPGGAAKLAGGLAAMDIDPSSFGGIDVLAAMDAHYNAATGKYGDDVFAQSLFMLARKALGQSVPAEANAYLISLQKADGAWEYCCGFGTDTNTTSIAVRALIAGGVASSDPSLVAAIAYFDANQAADGGFPYSAPFSSDANSTAYVIQAIVALGQSAEAGGQWDLGGGAHPLASLLSFQNPATGALQAFGGDSLLATYQGVPGLMLVAFPEQSAPDSYTATPTPTHTATPDASTGRSERTATRTATPVSTGTSVPASPPAAPTVVSTVLASTAEPASPSGVTALPDAGAGGDDARMPTDVIALAMSGVSLAAAGAAAMYARRRV